MTLPQMKSEQMLFQLRGLLERSRIKLQEKQAQPHPYRLSAPITSTPQSEEEIIRILSWANKERITVAPQGGGTKDALGFPVRPDMLLSMSDMSGVIEHSHGDLTVTVLPGTTVSELQRVLGEKGQFLPLDPAHPERCTIGGVISANSSGPSRTMYGSARDYVIASRVVYPDGRLIRTGAKVVKNVAGYDMNKLFIGAMGTLGVITELTLKTRPIPACSGMVIVAGSFVQLRELQAAMLDSQLEPSICEWMNEVLSDDSGLPSKATVVAVGFNDVRTAVDYQISWVTEYCKAQGLKVLDVLNGYERLETVNRHLRDRVPDARQMDAKKLAVIMKVLTSLTDVPEICNRVQQAADASGLDLRMNGGLYTGITRAGIEADWNQVESVRGWMTQVQAILREHQGHAVIEFAPVELRRNASVWGETSGTDALMRGIKQAVDPNRILNAGRFVGGI